MWWTSQNLERPVSTRNGQLWHFRVWHATVDGVYKQRIFFWDDACEDMGCIELPLDQALYITKIKQRMRKVVTDPSYRARFRRELKFPIERHYS